MACRIPAPRKKPGHVTVAPNTTPGGHDQVAGMTKGVAKKMKKSHDTDDSWVANVSALLTNTLVNDALKRNVDPRHDIKKAITEGVSLSGEDVKKLWYYIGREYPASYNLDDVLTELSPLVNVTPAEIMEYEAKLKYKKEIPSPPVTAFVQFTITERKKLLDKCPDLSGVDLMPQFTQKWRDMGPQRRGKYKKVYKANYKDYKMKLDEFYKCYPDAKENVRSKKSSGMNRDMRTASTGAVSRSPVAVLSPAPSHNVISNATNSLQTHDEEESEFSSSNSSQESDDSDEDGAQGTTAVRMLAMADSTSKSVSSLVNFSVASNGTNRNETGCSSITSSCSDDE